MSNRLRRTRVERISAGTAMFCLEKRCFSAYAIFLVSRSFLLFEGRSSRNFMAHVASNVGETSILLF